MAVLNQACAELDKLLNILIHKKNPSPVMVCSQLVYQCYLDCGDDYKIKLEDELLQSVCMNKIRLADLVNNPAFLSAGDDSDMSPNLISIWKMRLMICLRHGGIRLFL